MQLIISKHTMIKTICQNWLTANIIDWKEVEQAEIILNQYPIEDIVTTLISSHMLNPFNLMQQDIGSISEN